MVTTSTPVKRAAAKKAPIKTATTVRFVARKLVTPVAKTVKPKVVEAKVAAPKLAVTAAKQVKLKKTKLVRDSFTIPRDEYVVIALLKMRAGKLGQPVKKSELLRAGIKALAALTDVEFKAALNNVPAIKTGRPKDIK